MGAATISADSHGQMPPGADHLFISYAWEDRVIADWLTLRLTAAGYRVWCDRFKMLGGERFPEHIDEAIKNQTFRMLQGCSRSTHSTSRILSTSARLPSPLRASAPSTSTSRLTLKV